MSPIAVADEVCIAGGMPSSTLDRPSTIRTGDLVVDLDSRLVSVHDIPVRLTVRQGTTVTKEMLLNHLYGGTDEPELKIIDVFVCKLRKKLAQPTGSKYYIETIWGRGYKLRDPSPMSSATLLVGVENRDARDDEAGSRAI